MTMTAGASSCLEPEVGAALVGCGRDDEGYGYVRVEHCRTAAPCSGRVMSRRIAKTMACVCVPKLELKPGMTGFRISGGTHMVQHTAFLCTQQRAI